MNNQNNYLIPLSILAAGAMVAVSVFLLGNNGGASPETANPNQPATEEREQIAPEDIEYDTEGFASIGEADAPVTVVEYSDFACPFCKRFYEETKDMIIDEYVEAGLVRYVRKDFIAVGGNKAAEAAHCAAEQGDYFVYADILYANQANDRTNWGEAEVHRGYATELGLDAEALVACFESGKYAEKVARSTQEAQQNGGSGTPYFIINDTPVSGAQPFSVFKQVIDSQLNENE